MDLAAKVQGMIASDHRERIAKLEASLFGALRHAERSAILDAGKGKLWSGSDGLNVVKESTETKIETIHYARIQNASVVCEERMSVVSASLTLSSGTDRAIQSAWRHIIFPLQ